MPSIELSELVAIAAIWFAGSGARTYSLSASDFGWGREAGVVDSNPVADASGLAASQRNSGVLWTLNDSGGSNRVFAIKADGGDFLGSFALDGAIAGDCSSLVCVNGALDYEDLAVGPGPVEGASYLYVGDIGSGKSTRNTIEVHRVAEPKVDSDKGSDQSDTLGSVDTIVLKYPGKFYDSETLLFDPLSGDIYVVTKDRDEANRVYRARIPHPVDGTPIVLELMGTMDWELAVGGDVLFNGLEVIMKNKKSVFIYTREEEKELWEAIVHPAKAVSLRYIEEPQGESIGFAGDGMGFYTLSESVGAQTVPLYFYRRNGSLPTSEAPQPSPTVPNPLSPAFCEDQKTVSDCRELVTDTGCRWSRKAGRCSKARRCRNIRSEQSCKGVTKYFCAYSYKKTSRQVCTDFSNRCEVARSEGACEKNSGCQWNSGDCTLM
mmetsp:Transcript_60489/g.179232  ORF Transcript_60489/g.179232 Transcript_60489/m.179232 type:complete len:435 (-) Transcript_60489:169-1473(-)